MNITWILEPVVFADHHQRLAEAAKAVGHSVLWWKDDWLEGRPAPALDGDYALFHGSLQCAARVRAELGWRPGAFCEVDAFRCSAWYDQASEWLVHPDWRLTTVRELVDDPAGVLAELGIENRFFVRPDSPLKPFSGRVLAVEQLSLAALDHGFYYDDEDLPVVVAPVQQVGQEWRFVIGKHQVVTASAYEADGRSELARAIPQQVQSFASEVAKALAPPETVFVMDVCQSDNGLRLLELNPFSGADLYGCDRKAIVSAIAELARSGNNAR